MRSASWSRTWRSASPARAPRRCGSSRLTYGGGKTHSLITLYHLFRDPAALSDIKAVQEFRQHVGADLPAAFPVSLCLRQDRRRTRDRRGSRAGRRDPLPQAPLERARVSACGRRRPPRDPWRWRGRGTGDPARRAVPHEAAGASSEPRARHPDSGRRGAHVRAWQGGHGRGLARADRRLLPASRAGGHQGGPGGLGGVTARLRSSQAGISWAKPSNPISSTSFGGKGRKASCPSAGKTSREVLRRRLFEPESFRDPGAHDAHVIGVVGALASLDATTKKNRRKEEERFRKSYPFHPDLGDVFYSRWTQLTGFQRTRGILPHPRDRAPRRRAVGRVSGDRTRRPVGRARRGRGIRCGGRSGEHLHLGEVGGVADGLAHAAGEGATDRAAGPGRGPRVRSSGGGAGGGRGLPPFPSPSATRPIPRSSCE